MSDHVPLWSLYLSHFLFQSCFSPFRGPFCFLHTEPPSSTHIRLSSLSPGTQCWSLASHSTHLARRCCARAGEGGGAAGTRDTARSGTSQRWPHVGNSARCPSCSPGGRLVRMRISRINRFLLNPQDRGHYSESGCLSPSGDLLNFRQTLCIYRLSSSPLLFLFLT